MAAALGARVTCLHVTERSHRGVDLFLESGTGHPGSERPQGAARVIARRPWKKLRAFADEHFADLTPAPNLEVTEGKPVEAIVRYAEEHIFDLSGHWEGRSYSDPDLHENHHGSDHSHGRSDSRVDRMRAGRRFREAVIFALPLGAVIFALPLGAVIFALPLGAVILALPLGAVIFALPLGAVIFCAPFGSCDTLRSLWEL